MTERVQLGALYLSFRNALARAVSHIVPPRDIEDIVQEAYVRVCQVEQKEDIKYPRSLLLKTAKNLALDYVKSAGNRLNLPFDENELEELAGGRKGTTKPTATLWQKKNSRCFVKRCAACRPSAGGLSSSRKYMVLPKRRFRNI